MSFRTFLLKVQKAVKTTWGHSHPKEQLIRAIVQSIENADGFPETARPIIAHLQVCKPCAEVCCGFVNQAHASKRVA